MMTANGKRLAKERHGPGIESKNVKLQNAKGGGGGQPGPEIGPLKGVGGKWTEGGVRVKTKKR